MHTYKIHLTQAERETLRGWVKTGERKAKVIQQAQVLLGSDEAKGRLAESELAESYHLSIRSVERIRKKFFAQGMDMFEKQERKVRSDKKIDGRVEAHLVALVCQGPPPGASRWKLQLLADRLVELEVVEHISSTMVGNLLKKTNYSLSGRRVG